jgi:hypothetical protein
LVARMILLASTYNQVPHYAVYFTPRHLLALRHKYSPQHSILRHIQPMVLPQCERPSSLTFRHRASYM